jgi:predicted TIM-barrel fold metal-dependent hydrolase
MSGTGAIDILCYLFTNHGLKKMFIEPPEFQHIVKWWKMEDGLNGWSIEEFIAKMDAAGVDKVCIPAVKMARYPSREMIWDISTEEVAEVVRANPERFIGLAGIHPFRGKSGLEDLTNAVKIHGFKGAYLHTYGFGLPLNDKRYYPYYAKCVELNIPVLMQVGHSAERMPNELGRPMLMDDIALDFPELNIVGAHTGWPWVEEMISLAWKHANVYVGIDAHMPKFLDPSLLQFLKSRGKDKVLYGTNGPLRFTHEDTLQQIDEWGLKPEVKSKILRENAVRIGLS